jgi:hypothetical protein
MFTGIDLELLPMGLSPKVIYDVEPDKHGWQHIDIPAEHYAPWGELLADNGFVIKVWKDEPVHMPYYGAMLYSPEHDVAHIVVVENGLVVPPEWPEYGMTMEQYLDYTGYFIVEYVSVMPL